MKVQEIAIHIRNAKAATLTLYLQTDFLQFQPKTTKPMLVICPGGGYEHVSAREGEAIALQFLASGCHCAVLRYDVEETVFPQHLLELAEAVAIIREHAQEYHIAKDKIIVAGFSAGGHLAASLGCFWKKEWLQKLMFPRIAKDYAPNGLLLAYPVLTSGEYAHRGSFEHLLGDKLSTGCKDTGLSGKELLEYLSLENQVTKDVPPVFMWHTFEDGAVPLENSLLFARALKEHAVNFEYHVFPHGGHGYALGTKETTMESGKEIDPQIPAWRNLCAKWLEVNF